MVRALAQRKAANWWPQEKSRAGVLTCAKRRFCYDCLRMAVRRIPSLLESSPWLRDPEERADRILDVVESNGIIEGLPAFTQGARERLHAFLAADATRG